MARVLTGRCPVRANREGNIRLPEKLDSDHWEFFTSFCPWITQYVPAAIFKNWFNVFLGGLSEFGWNFRSMSAMKSKVLSSFECILFGIYQFFFTHSKPY